jgi:hypothetical protein
MLPLTNTLVAPFFGQRFAMKSKFSMAACSTGVKKHFRRCSLERASRRANLLEENNEIRFFLGFTEVGIKRGSGY